MKQTKLVINVYVNGTELVQTINPATLDNVRSCIDIWHNPGTSITLDFVEFEVDANITSNN